jgi:hypothetical protein
MSNYLHLKHCIPQYVRREPFRTKKNLLHVIPYSDINSHSSILNKKFASEYNWPTCTSYHRSTQNTETVYQLTCYWHCRHLDGVTKKSLETLGKAQLSCVCSTTFRQCTLTYKFPVLLNASPIPWRYDLLSVTSDYQRPSAIGIHVNKGGNGFDDVIHLVVDLRPAALTTTKK